MELESLLTVLADVLSFGGTTLANRHGSVRTRRDFPSMNSVIGCPYPHPRKTERDDETEH